MVRIWNTNSEITASDFKVPRNLFAMNRGMRHDAMKAYVQALDARDFVLLCNFVREERRRRESSAAGFTVIAGLLDLLEMTSTEAFGAIGAIVPGTRVRILARVCRRARQIIDRALLASLQGLVLRPKPSASKQQLESIAFDRLGSGTVQLVLDWGMDSLIAPLTERMQVAVKQQAWGGLHSLRIAGCPQAPMHQLCQLLPSFCLLEKLELVESGLSNESARKIAEGIASARNLRTLDLSGNDVSDRAHNVCLSAERPGACPPMPSLVSKDAPGLRGDYATPVPCI